MVAAQAASALRAGLFVRHAAFNIFKITFALGCLTLFGVDAAARGADVQMRRRDLHIGTDLMVETELLVDIGRRDLEQIISLMGRSPPFQVEAV